MLYEGVKMYNSLPVELKQGERLNKFKRMSRGYILSGILYIPDYGITGYK